MARTQILSQVIAVERSLKGKWESDKTALHRESEKAEFFQGFTRTYRPLTEGEETYPPEAKRVQLRAEDVFTRLRERLTDLFNTTATKDNANCAARADVIVDGAAVLLDIPVPTLLWLEKQLTDLNTFVAKMPTLDPAYDWAPDAASGLMKTSVETTHKTKKAQKALVLAQATEKHPAQTQMIVEDVVIGYWDQTRLSGAMPAPARQAILRRIESLLKAVKTAREQANTTAAPPVDIATKVFGYLFNQ